MNLERVRANVLRMMRKFPSRTVTISRRTADAYGQPTDTETELGTFTCWSEGANRPTKWDVTDGGTRYESEGARWICLIWTEELPQARAGDIVRFAGSNLAPAPVRWTGRRA